MEEALAWAWRSGGGLHEAKRNESRRSGASPKARLLEWRNTKAGWALLSMLPKGLLWGAADGIGCGIGVFTAGGKTGDRHEKQEAATKC